MFFYIFEVGTQFPFLSIKIYKNCCLDTKMLSTCIGLSENFQEQILKQNMSELLKRFNQEQARTVHYYASTFYLIFKEFRNETTQIFFGNIEDENQIKKSIAIIYIVKSPIDIQKIYNIYKKHNFEKQSVAYKFPINIIPYNYLGMSLEKQTKKSLQESEEAQNYSREVIQCLSSKKKHDQNIRHGKWDQQQKLRFVIFIDFHEQMFSGKKNRKKQDFNQVSKFLSTRTPQQCRNHLRALLHRHKSVKKIISYYKKQVGDVQYEQNFDFFKTMQADPLDSNQLQQQSPDKEYVSIQIQTDPVNLEMKENECEFHATLWASLFQTQYSCYKYGINLDLK